ncbi:MAG TPA: HhH-GPD-type base excision DNA repair protein [Pseudonocardia sp.]|jgi:uncharacterized HhH-GPD family protein
METSLCLAQDSDADALLASSSLALLFGMLLDQQIPMEKAFRGPKDIADRMGTLDVRQIADSDPESFAAIVAQRPAVHRFPGSMAKRLQTLAQYLLEHYDGDVEEIWRRDQPDGAEVLRRLKALPGFGEQKAKIFLALLGKQRGVSPAGWREAAGDYGEQGSYRSVADVVDAESLGKVRAFKQQMKARAKQAAEATGR